MFKYNTQNLISLVVIICVGLVYCADVRAERFRHVHRKALAAKQEWSVADAFATWDTRAPFKLLKYDSQGNAGRWLPCIRPKYVTRAVRYAPKVKECGGNAGTFLLGKWRHIYSIVVRDSQNRDRWPYPNGVNGCSSYETTELALNKCSVFKPQSETYYKDGKRSLRLVCYGASGYSDYFSDVVRMTAKITDDPTSSNDPLVRFCLKSGDKPLNFP